MENCQKMLYSVIYIKLHKPKLTTHSSSHSVSGGEGSGFDISYRHGQWMRPNSSSNTWCLIWQCSSTSPIVRSMSLKCTSCWFTWSELVERLDSNTGYPLFLSSVAFTTSMTASI